MTKRRADIAFVVLFVFFTLVQFALIYFTQLNLSPDEAQYWGWSGRLDWSYYSKGPLVAYLIALSTRLLGDTAFAVRIPAALCFSLFSLFFYLFARKLYSASSALKCFIALRSMLIFAQSGYLMTTDSAAVLFWLLALWCAFEAIKRQTDKRSGQAGAHFWLLFGLCTGLGVWGKYTVAFIYPSVFVFLLLEPDLRKQLKSTGFLGGMFVFLLSLIPILYWNYLYGWVNFSHNLGHLVQPARFGLKPWYFVELLAGQAGLVGPLLFVCIIWALSWGLQYYGKSSRVERFLLCASLPLALLVVVVSFTKRIYVNWPLPVYIGGLLLLAGCLEKEGMLAKRLRRFFRPAVGLNFLILLSAHAPVLGFTFGLSPSLLPSARLAGWDLLGQKVEEALKLNQGDQPLLIITHDYAIASEISFYAPSHPFVYCTNIGWRRMNQHDIWTKDEDWEKLQGRNALLVFKEQSESAWARAHFEKVEELSPSPYVTINYAGSPIRSFYFYNAEGFDGKPPPPPQEK